MKIEYDFSERDPVTGLWLDRRNKKNEKNSINEINREICNAIANINMLLFITFFAVAVVVAIVSFILS